MAKTKILMTGAAGVYRQPDPADLRARYDLVLVDVTQKIARARRSRTSSCST